MLKEISVEEWNYESYNKPGRFWIRVIAFIIDWIIFIPVIIILKILPGIDLPSGVVESVVMFYFVIYHWRKGATIGKSQTELRVENANGNRISLKQSILRILLPAIALAINLYVLSQNTMTISVTYISQVGDEITYTRPYDTTLHFLALGSTLIWIIDILWIVTNKEKRALHDIIAGTYVREK